MFGWKTWITLIASILIVAGAAVSAQQAPSDPPPGEGLDLIQRSCVSCHDIYMITTKRKTREEWSTIVGLMADRGADVTPEEMQIIADYLSKNF
jgi:mono/diheme cytochrome c family protein